MITSFMSFIWFSSLTLISLLIGASNTNGYGYVRSKLLDKLCMVTFYTSSVGAFVSGALWLFGVV